MRKIAKLYLLLMVLSGTVNAAEVEPFRDLACPEEWSVNGEVIPVIDTGVSPWGQGGSDKALAKKHLSSADIVPTIDAVPVTDDGLVDDLLTVASECLVYQNMLVNGEQYYPPAPSVEHNPEFGFVAASIF